LSGSGAYEDDMLRPLSHVRDEDIDLLLAGHHRDEELGDIAAFLGGLIDAVAEAPAEGASRRHLAAIVQVAGEAAARGHVLDSRARLERSRARRWSPVLRTRFVRVMARALVVAVGASFLSVGLALAGVVDLPEVADDALARVGVTLPEQAGGPETESVPSAELLPEDADETAFAVIGAIETYLPQLQDGTISGCEFGAFVSAAATGEEVDTNACSASAAAGEQETVGAQGGAETGDQASSGGMSVADQAEQGALEGSSETGDQASAGGESVADDASGGQASDAQQTGQDATTEGQGNKP